MGSGWRMRRSSDLEARIWSSLPEDLLLRVLSFLPIKCLLRLRCVNTRWNDILTSSSFARLLAEAPKPDLPWILTFKSSSRKLKAFDRSSNRWFWVRLPFLNPCSAAELVAASKGLLCFSIGSGEFLISNPVLQDSWRMVPFPSSDLLSSVTLVSEEDGFQVVVTGSSRRMPRVIEIFNSATNSWRVIGQPPVASSFRSETAFCSNHLYFATRSEPPSLLSLDLEFLTWRDAQPLPHPLVFCIPVVANGVLHLVGGLGTYGIAKSMSIWRFSSGLESRWEEVERMPEAAWTKLAMSCYHNYEKISCMSQEDLICFFCCSWCQEMLVFCVAQRCWIWLPVCEQATSRGVKWFSLEPCIMGP